jgi:hypothetical protein
MRWSKLMDNSNTSAYYFFVGWSLILLAFFGMNKFEGTRTVLYYLLWLLVVFDIVSHYAEIQSILAQAGFQISTITPANVPVNLAVSNSGGALHGT